MNETNMPTEPGAGPANFSNERILVFCTPKTAARIEKHKLPAPFDQSELKIIPCSEVYINLLDPEWTEEMCDNMLYFLPEKVFLENNRGVSYKMDYNRTSSEKL